MITKPGPVSRPHQPLSRQEMDGGGSTSKLLLSVAKFAGALLLGAVFLLLLINSILALTVKNYYPKFFGNLLVSVVTDSMSPTIKPGRLIACKTPPPVEEIREDDIVTYRVATAGGVSVITHRITYVLELEDGVYYNTRGDNAPAEDDYNITYADIIGVYTGKSVPVLGYLFSFFSSLYGLLCLILVLGTVAFSLFIHDGLKRQSQEEILRKTVLTQSAILAYTLKKRYRDDIDAMSLNYSINLLNADPEDKADKERILKKIEEFATSNTLRPPRKKKAVEIPQENIRVYVKKPKPATDAPVFPEDKKPTFKTAGVKNTGTTAKSTTGSAATGGTAANTKKTPDTTTKAKTTGTKTAGTKPTTGTKTAGASSTAKTTGAAAKRTTPATEKTTPATAAKPKSTAAPKSKPAEPKSKPTAEPKSKPAEPKTKPAEPKTKPVEPKSKPIEPKSKPAEPKTKPAEPKTKPVEPKTKPIEPETTPVKPKTKPAEPKSKPAEPKTTPTEPKSKPPEPKTKPVEPQSEPQSKPIEPESKPADDAAEAVVTQTKQPAAPKTITGDGGLIVEVVAAKKGRKKKATVTVSQDQLSMPDQIEVKIE